MHSLNLLIVEDQPLDAELIVDALVTDGFELTWERVETESDYLLHLTPAVDLILSDYNLPRFDGLRALSLLKDSNLDIPFILVSGSIGDDLAVRAMRAGAADYLLKDRPARLGQAVLAALEQKRLRDEKKRADEELVKVQQHFRALIEKSADAIVLIDPAGTVVYASPTITRILGGEPGYWLGGNWLNRAHPDDLATVSTLFAQIMQAPGVSLTAQFRYRHIEGHWLWLEATGTNLLDEPSVRAIVGNIRNITERKRAEESMHESEERFRRLFEASPDAILLLDPTDADARWPIVDCNDRACQMNGYTREELIGQSIDVLNLEPGTPSGRAEYLERIRQNGILRLEALHRHKDGHVFAVETSTSLLTTGGRQLVLGIDRDISERKQAEADTAQRADQFAALYQTAQDLSEQKHLQTLLQTIVERATVLLGTPEGAIFLYEPIPQQLEAVVVKGSQVPRGLRLAVGEGMAGHVAQMHEPLIVDDYSHWPQRTKQLQDMTITTCLNVPMLFGGELIGVLGVYETVTDRKYTDADVKLLSLFASQAASAVHNTRLLEATQQHAAQLATLNGIGRALSTLQNIDELLELIYQQVQHSLQLDTFYVGLYESETNQFVYRLMYDEGKRYQQEAGALLRQTHLGQVVRDGVPVLLNRSAEELSYKDPQGRLANMAKPSASLLFAPLQIGQRIIGAMSAQSYTLNAYTPADLSLLVGIASQAAIAIENARLFEETNQQVRFLGALRTIDMAISGSVDLRTSLDILLDQVLTQLKVHASRVLSLNPHMNVLEFINARGFHTRGFERSHIRLGVGLAGRAALERRMIVSLDLAGEMADAEWSQHVREEKFSTYYGVPLISKGRVTGVLEIFHRGPLTPGPEWLNFLDALAGQAAIAIDNATLFQGLERSNLDLANAYDATIEGWSRALDLRDKETEGHSQRVTDGAVALASRFGFTGQELLQLRRGALLHDIGKMGIPDHILLKPGPLTDDEWKIMRMHPVYAYELLGGIAYLRPALDVPYCHHEKWDGSGYPRGLRGEGIPLSARIFSVVDVWDALRSDRPYRRAWTEHAAREHLVKEVGKQFDPAVVEAYLNLLDSSKRDA